MAGSERHPKDVAKKHDHKAEEKRRVDRKLDEALEEFFPGLRPRVDQPAQAEPRRQGPCLICSGCRAYNRRKTPRCRTGFQ